MNLSAIIITRNESHNIEHCINELKFCDEIIVLDSGSQDGTLEIAESMGCRVICTDDWPGFGIQKQRALNHALGEWVLSIDADERLTPQLREEIKRVITQESYAGFQIKRKSKFLGQWMRFGGWSPDYVLRLARREVCRFDLSPVHEKMIVDGSVGRLRHHLLHYSYRSINDILSKQHRYALISAEKIRCRKGNHVSVIGASLRSGWTFFRLYCLRLGLLDGRRGLISAIFKAQETFWKYVAVEFSTSEKNQK